MLKNFPVVLTLSRIALVPVFVLFFYLLPSSVAPIAATVVFTAAALTDYFDGLLARMLNQASRFGAFLDPVADKLLVCVALVLVVSQREGPLLAIPAAIIISRELLVSGLREWMAEIGKRASVAVNIIGKLKAVVQMIAIGVLIFCFCNPNPAVGSLEASGKLQFLGITLLYLASVLTVWTMVMYLQVAWKDLEEAIDSPNP